MSSNFDPLKQFLRKTLLLNNELTPELFVILSVYLVQGITESSRLALSFFFKDDLNLNPAEVEALLGLLFVPWMIKPLYGFLSDRFPLGGYHRRSYLLLVSLVSAISWVSLSQFTPPVWGILLVLLVGSAAAAFSDVVVDALLVERIRQATLNQGSALQSLAWGTQAFGHLLTAYLVGWLLQQLGTHAVFALQAIGPFLIAAMVGAISETKIQKDIDEEIGADINEGGIKHSEISFGSQLRSSWQVLTQKPVLLPMLFIFFWRSLPSAETGLFYFTTNELHFSPEFLGRVALIMSLASLVGIWFYQRFLLSVSLRWIFIWGTGLSVLVSLALLLLVTHTNRAIGIDDQWFLIGDRLVYTVIGRITWIPVLVFSARLCPVGVEATVFALLMSFWNLSATLSKELGAILTHGLGITATNFDQLPLLIVMTSLLVLITLPFLALLPSEPIETSPLVESNFVTSEESLR